LTLTIVMSPCKASEHRARTNEKHILDMNSGFTKLLF